MEMTDKQMLTTMFEMQQKLNDDTNGKGWESGYNKFNRIISWKRCIYMECAELIDSFIWKHWKNINGTPDWQNIQIEVIDIWHFIMSLALETYYNNKMGGINEIVSYILDNKSFKTFCKEKLDTNNIEQMEIINQIERIINVTSGVYKNSFEMILGEYFTVAHECGLNLKSLYKIYIGKNILNSFRQNHGYKEGTYKKIWGKIEDNVVMNKLIDKMDVVTPNELYNLLEEKYKQLN